MEFTDTYTETDAAYESVFDYACEATTGKIIDTKTRDALPDSAFGIEKERKYPLLVKNDPKLTHELCSKAIQMFHFCKPDWKEELAKKIVKVVTENKVSVKINKKSQIFKYVDIDKVPPEYLTESAPKK